jgi:hypothetical protein
MAQQRLEPVAVPSGCNHATPPALRVPRHLVARDWPRHWRTRCPTTDEAEEDQNIADAAAGKRSIVNQVGPDSFDKDGLRPFFQYRSLGLEELTGGKVGAQVLRAKPGQYADALRHSHTLEFQFIYVPKAGRSSTTKAMASTSWSPARPSISRPESRTRRSSPFMSAPRGAILAA